MLIKLWELPNSFGEAEPEVQQEAKPAEPATECEKQVVYRHHFSERVVHQQAERRADLARMEQLENDVRRLTSDLRQAERSLIAVESKLSGAHTRARAVRAMAEARSQLERAARDAPWQVEELRAARQKLDAADKQIRAGHYGAAMLFASRAKRSAGDIAAEGRAVRNAKDVSQVRAELAAVREKPSRKSRIVVKLARGTPVFPEKREKGWVLVRTTTGKIGWVAGSLLGALPASPAR